MTAAFRNAVVALIDEYDMCPPGETVLCALSGGADSMCLTHFLAGLGRERGFTVCAAHFDHRLRGTASAQDAAFVSEWCRENGIPLTLGTGDVTAEAKGRGMSVEEAGRELRYAFLTETAKKVGAKRIATAHHADDNLETLLLRLTRGSGLKGLSGIPPRRGSVVRPLLEVSRADILAYLSEYGIPHVEDATNQDRANPRNLIRHEVVPVLRTLNPNLSATAARTQRSLRQDNAYLNAQAARAVAMAQVGEDGVTVHASAIAALPEAVAVRAVRRLWEGVRGGDGRCTANHLLAVVALARSKKTSGRVTLPDGWEAVRSYGLLLLCRKKEAAPPEAVPLPDEGTFLWGDGWSVTCERCVCPEGIQKNPAVFYLACDMLGGGTVVRTRRTGDVLALPGRTGSKTLKKWMIERRVPRALRDRLPVLADEKGVVAATGIGVSSRCAAVPGENALRVTIEKTQE